MAKDFPYFKFYVSEWNDKDVTLCTLKAQGLFINICATYWSRLGDFKLTKAIKKFRNKSSFDELIEEGIIDVDREQDSIIIKFLDIQLAEREILSIRNTENVRKRYEPSTSRSKVVDGSNTIKKREEEKRREKRREEENKKGLVFPFTDDDFKKQWQLWKDYKKEQFNFKYKSLGEQAALKKLGDMAGSKEQALKIIDQSMGNGWKGFIEIKTNGKSITDEYQTSRMADYLAGK